MRQRLNYLTDTASPVCKECSWTADVRPESRQHIFYIAGGLLVLAMVCAIFVSVSVASEPQRPKFDQVATTVTNYLRSQPNYQDGDLVSQKQVAAALDAVADLGWKVPDRDQIEQRALADGSFLATQLSTPAGRKFMRKIASKPGAYQRLDQLSTISRGERTVRDLVQKKGGDEFIEYLATTSSGRNFGRMMARTKNGVDLNKPTGRIYTANDLLKALKTVYASSTP